MEGPQEGRWFRLVANCFWSEIWDLARLSGLRTCVRIMVAELFFLLVFWYELNWNAYFKSLNIPRILANQNISEMIGPMPGPKTYVCRLPCWVLQKKALPAWLNHRTNPRNFLKAEMADAEPSRLFQCWQCWHLKISPWTFTKSLNCETETELPGEKTMLRHSKLEIKDALTNATCTERRESGSKTKRSDESLEGMSSDQFALLI